MTDTLGTVSNGYIELPVDVDPQVLQESALANIAADLPGWLPREGHIEVLLLEQFAAMCAESAVVAGQVPLAIFSYFGTLIGIPPLQGAAAEAETTWVMKDSAGYTVPAGTIVQYNLLGNSGVQFVTIADFTVPNGQTSISGIVIQATTQGAAANGLTPQVLSLVSATTNFISSVNSTSISSGGVDAETTTQYLNRLSYELQTITPRPILPRDFAILATQVDGVYRAAAYSGLNPFANQFTTEDATFTPAVGSWTAVQNVATPTTGTGAGGEPVMIISPTGSSTAIVATANNIYTTTAGEQFLYYATLDHSTFAGQVNLFISFYDINGVFISSSSTPTGTFVDSTSKVSVVWGTFTAPANAFYMQPEIQVATFAGSTDHHRVAVASISEVNAAPTNHVPDSAFEHITSSLSWILSGGGAVAAFATGEKAIVYTGTGASSSQSYISNSFYLPAGTYAVGGYIDATHQTAGATTLQLFNNAGTSQITITQVNGDVGTVFGAVTVTAGMYFYEFASNGTVALAEPLTLAEPQVTLAGSTTIDQVALTSNVATITTVSPHGLAVNDKVIIAGLTNTIFNGLVTVTAVSTTTTFTFALTHANVSPTTDSGTVSENSVQYQIGPTYSPPNQLTNQERMVTVAVVDVNGNPLSSAIEAEVSADLQSLREINFIVNTVSPNYTSIDVTWTGVAETTANAAAVQAAQLTALTAYLSQANWAGGDLTPPSWDVTQNIVRYLQVVGLLDDIPGLDYLTSVKIGYHNQSVLGTVDLPLIGFAPLPTPGTLSGIVTDS